MLLYPAGFISFLFNCRVTGVPAPGFFAVSRHTGSCHIATPGHLPDSSKGVPGHFYIPARSGQALKEMYGM